MAGSAAEWLRLNGQLVAVPSVVCERRPAFDAALSQTAWDTLSEEHRSQLRTLLPSFPGDDAGKEQDETVRRLFAGESFRFGNPLDHFFKQLHEGQLTDQIHSLRRLTEETQRHDARVWRQNYMDDLLRELVKKRKLLLDAAIKTPPDAAVSLPPAKRRCRRKLLEQRARKRYFRELELARVEAGCPADDLSADENYPEGPPAVLSRKQQRHLAKLEATLGGDHVLVAATDSRQPARGLHLAEHASPERNPYQVAETRLSQLLQQHKRRRARGQVPAAGARDRQRLDLQSLLKRSPPPAHSTDSDSDTAPAASTASIAIKKSSSPPPALPSSSTSATATTAALAVTSSTTTAATATATATATAAAATPWQSTALGQKTHTSFFSLLRDVFCSDPADRLAEPSVFRAVAAWQRSPISPLNDWYTQEASWVDALASALAFLSGEVRELQSQINLVPFLDHGLDSGVYQWIGAGRDSDLHLESLCAYWIQTKDTINVKREPATSDGGGPPAALHPTSWTVQPSTPAEREEYRKQERQRYQAPRRAFTYRLHGYRATVGPVRSGRDSKAGRGHTLLSGDRPAGATLLSLVRDAVARLPNGEGSRADVCELVRDSGYLVPGGGDQLVSAAVSSALDRLQAELDPCVKYDSHRKLWVCLHRHRTEAEFETLERQRQASSPRRRQAVKRSAPAAPAVGGGSAVAAAGSTPAGVSLLKPRASLTTTGGQPKLSVPPPPLPPAAAAVSAAALPREPTGGLTQTELAVQSILPSAVPSASPAPVRTSVVSAHNPGQTTVQTFVQTSVQPSVQHSVQIPVQTSVQASVHAPAPTPTPTVAPAPAAQLQLVSRAAALSPSVAASPPLVAPAQTPTVQSVKVVKNQHAIVHIPSKTPGAAPQLALLANGKLIPIVNQPATVKTADGRPRASLLVTPPRPVMARGRAVTAVTQPVRPAITAVTVQESPLRPLLSRPAAAVTVAPAPAVPASPQLIQVSAAAQPAAAAVPASGAGPAGGGGALKHITIPVSQLSRLLQQQAGGGAGSAAGTATGALTLAQIGGRQVLIAARPAAKTGQQQGQLVHRLQAPTHTVQTVQSVPTVQTVQAIQQPQQVVLQGAAPARQLSAVSSQLQLTSGAGVSAVRPVSAGRPVVLSSPAQQQVLLPSIRGLQSYKLVQLPAASAATVQARGVSVAAAAVQPKAVARPDLLAPLVAATLSSPVVASSAATGTSATPALPDVSHT